MELKKLCVLSSLPVSGSKQELVDRILAHEAGKSVTVQPDEEAELLDEDDNTTEDVVVTLTAPTTAAESASPSEEKSPPEASAEPESNEKTPVLTTIGISKMSQEEVCTQFGCFSVFI